MKLNKLFVLTLFCLAILPFTTSAQMALNVEGIGKFKGTLANFKKSNPCEIDDISAPLRIANDGTSEVFACDSFVDLELRGKLALIHRGGTCPFDLKAAHAEANGAIGVIICNDEPGRRPFGLDRANPQIVSIPTILISLQDCTFILNALNANNDIAATLAYDDMAPPASVNVVWGDQPGQGEFDGGLDGWTVDNCTVDRNGTIIDPDPVTWTWYENPIDEFLNSQMISYSRCNGAVGFDATNWNLITDGSHPVKYPNHHCELISPIIDLSSAGPVSLQFWQVNFGLNGNDNPGDASMRVFVSIDGGMTYNEQIDVESGNILTPDQTIWANGELKKYYLPRLAGESNVRLKFEYYSDFYAWYIDDVYFTEPDIDVAILESSANIELKLFPNPANNEINLDVEFQNTVNKLEINITDIVGRIIDVQIHTKVKGGIFNFDLSHYNNGVYFAKIITDEKLITKKFVISK